MTELCDLADKYGSDKCPKRKHHFTGFYYDLFAPRRETVRKVLEIGIGIEGPGRIRGASLRMWRDFFPHAQVYGADIDDAALFTDKRILTRVCDQTDPSQLEDLIEWTGPDLDLLVEDGCHDLEVQVATAKTLLPLLAPGTLYVIEDTQPVWNERIKEFSSYNARVWVPRFRKWQDDRLVVVQL